MKNWLNFFIALLYTCLHLFLVLSLSLIFSNSISIYSLSFLEKIFISKKLFNVSKSISEEFSFFNTLNKSIHQKYGSFFSKFIEICGSISHFISTISDLISEIELSHNSLNSKRFSSSQLFHKLLNIFCNFLWKFSGIFLFNLFSKFGLFDSIFNIFLSKCLIFFFFSNFLLLNSLIFSLSFLFNLSFCFILSISLFILFIDENKFLISCFKSLASQDIKNLKLEYLFFKLFNLFLFELIFWLINLVSS